MRPKLETLLVGTEELSSIGGVYWLWSNAGDGRAGDRFGLSGGRCDILVNMLARALDWTRCSWTLARNSVRLVILTGWGAVRDSEGVGLTGWGAVRDSKISRELDGMRSSTICASSAWKF